MIKFFKLNFLLFAFLVVISCKKNEQENIEIQDVETTQTIPTEFTSQLRNGEKLQLGTIYTDSVEYIKFDDNYDELLTFVKKGNDTITLISNKENSDFVRGDVVEIKWKIDSLRPAGDPKYLDFTEFLISAKRIKSLQLTDKKIKFLWTQSIFDKKYDAEVNSLMVDYDYIKTITEPEKAALAYVSMFYGNECEWDGEPNENRTNLKCKIPWALGLRYQCSFEQKALLKYWFRKNKQILKELESCPTIPNTATIQSFIHEIDIETSSDIISIFFKIGSTNIRTLENWEWTENIDFQFNTNEILLINKQVSKKEYSKLEINNE
jgi:hypothetical protein